MGPTSPDYTDAYLETTSVIRREDVDCSPCQQKVCPLGHHQCMTFIEPEAVIEEVRRWLARASDSSEGAERA
jgi:heptosyltransferase-2